MSAVETFVDTNILVYAHDRDAGAKHEVAADAIRALWASGRGALSLQVIQELWITLTRKIRKPLPRKRARELLRNYSQWTVHRPETEDILVATELEVRHKLSFWDSLIIVSAARSGARKLLTEDLNHGQRIEGVEILNPFAG